LQGIARLQNATGEAASVLQEIMSDKESPRVESAQARKDYKSRDKIEATENSLG
jgi:hypothetical protein